MKKIGTHPQKMIKMDTNGIRIQWYAPIKITGKKPIILSSDFYIIMDHLS